MGDTSKSPKNGGFYRTRSLSVANYLVFVGKLRIHKSSLEFNSKSGAREYLIIFEDPNFRGPQLHKEFLQSRYQRWDDSLRNLKNFINDNSENT